MAARRDGGSSHCDRDLTFAKTEAPAIIIVLDRQLLSEVVQYRH
jgi:hypothetical protein